MEKINGGNNESEVLTQDELVEAPLTTPEEDAKASAALQEILEQAKISEEVVPEKIAAISAEIKDFKSPEEIKSEIERLKAEYEEKKQAYQSFTHVSGTDSGMGALGSFGVGKMSPAKLEEKFPGISNALDMIKKAEKKNSVGLKFWKNPELDDFQFQVIKNYLTTGSMGNFTNPKMEAVAKNTLNKFLEENKNPEANVSSVKQAIWGSHDGSYYEGAIAHLNKQLTNTQEK